MGDNKNFYFLERFTSEAINHVLPNKIEVISTLSRKNFPTLYHLLFSKYIEDFEPIRKDIMKIIDYITNKRCTQQLLLIIENSHV